jgi:hypothetical protein
MYIYKPEVLEKISKVLVEKKISPEEDSLVEIIQPFADEAYFSYEDREILEVAKEGLKPTKTNIKKRIKEVIGE